MFTVQGKKSYELTNSDGQWFVNGDPFDGSIYPEEKGSFVVIHNNKSYTAQIISSSADKKQQTIKVNGNYYQLKVKDRLDILVDKMGMSGTEEIANDTIKAPMPGMIISVNVKVGDTVEKGQKLCVLEAMKMENSIKADHEGDVKEVLIEKGQTVEKNQLLVRL